MIRSGYLKPCFALLTVCAVLLLAEGFCRITGIGDPLHAPDPFVGFAGHHPLFQYRDGPAPEWVVPEEKIQQGFHPNAFSAVKPTSVLRVFALGGSTVWGDGAGGRSGAFPYCLERIIHARHPDLPLEMINCGVKGYASYRIRRLVEEIVRYEPDLILLYTGHNELLEKRFQDTEHTVNPWVDSVKLRLHRTHLYTLLWTGLQAVRPGSGHREILDDELVRADDPIQFDMARVAEMAPVSDSEWNQIVERFRWNYRKILQICADNHIPILVILPAYRLWMPPQVPIWSHPMPPDSHRLFQQTLVTAETALRTQDMPELDRSVSALMDLDSGHAMVRYLNARRLWLRKDTSAAREELLAAKDLDRRGHRQPEIIRWAMISITARTHTPMLDAQTLLETDSPPDAPFGNDYFVDHVHLNRRGHERIARMLYEIISDRQLLSSASPSQ